MAKKITLVLSDSLYNRLMEFCKKNSMSIQDVLIPAIVKVLEAMEGGKR